MFRICAALACALALIVSTAFADPPPRDAALDAMMAYLERAQNPDGGFGGRLGGESDPGFSAWVALGFAAAGTNPLDRKADSGADVYSYLAVNISRFRYTTDWERVLLVAIATGTNPRDFGGQDPVARILERQLPDGSFKHEASGRTGGVNDTAFAVLALSQVDDAAAKAVIPAAVDWLIAQQRDDGAWGYAPKTGYSSDMTGAVIQALIAGGRRGTEAERKGFEYLKTLQHDNGGFTDNTPGAEPNVASTAWAVQGMWAAGVDPKTWNRPGGNPLDYMRNMQQADGSVRWKQSEDLNPVWMTAYVAPAYGGHPLPIPRTPRSIPPTPTPTASATPTGTPGVQPGPGGALPDGGNGVKAGGGGGGAPLFSQPKPQSQGRTRGGARETDGNRVKPRATATPRPGAQPRATSTPRPRARPRPTPSSPRRTTADPTTATPTPIPPSATATPSPTPTPTPDSAGGSGDGSGPSLAGDPSSGSGGGGGSSLPYVRGTIVSTDISATDLAAAPGMRGAGAGGDATVAARLIAAMLLIALSIGWALERRQTLHLGAATAWGR